MCNILGGLKKNLNASRPSEHPHRGEKMSKRLGGIMGYKDISRCGRGQVQREEVTVTPHLVFALPKEYLVGAGFRRLHEQRRARQDGARTKIPMIYRYMVYYIYSTYDQVQLQCVECIRVDALICTTSSLLTTTSFFFWHGYGRDNMI